MNRPQTIAGVVLTLNEEKDLARALSSLKWCDELLVVDSGSKDRTGEVAEQCGAQFVEHLQTQPFLITEQRNWALDQAGLTSDWVLFLDADEEVSPALAELIRYCVSSQLSIDAYELTPRYWFLGRWLKRTQGYPNWHPRLVRRGFVTFAGGVWETFVPNARVGRISLPYEHYAFSKGMDDWLDRHIRYANWEANEVILASQKSQPNSVNRYKNYRSPRLRRLANHLWILRAPLRFFQKYIFQLGFTEGWQSFLFCCMMATYDLITTIKVIEYIRKDRGMPL